jgi:hypothetical protein
MHTFGYWLARSPIASAFKVALGAVLDYVLVNVAEFDIPVVAQVAIIAAVPILINALNPHDHRYGSHADESVEH